MWRAKGCEPEQIKRLREARERFDLRPLAVHVNYLVNLARKMRRSAPNRSPASATNWSAHHRGGYLYSTGSYHGQSIEEGVANFATGLSQAVISPIGGRPT